MRMRTLQERNLIKAIEPIREVKKDLRFLLANASEEDAPLWRNVMECLQECESILKEVKRKGLTDKRKQELQLRMMLLRTYLQEMDALIQKEEAR